MKFNKTRMYKEGSHTTKKGVVPAVEPLLPSEQVDEKPIVKKYKSKKKKK